MPHEIMIALNIIFALIIIEAVRIAGRIIKEKKKERKFINRIQNMERGESMGEKCFNGRFVWK